MARVRSGFRVEQSDCDHDENTVAVELVDVEQNPDWRLRLTYTVAGPEVLLLGLAIEPVDVATSRGLGTAMLRSFRLAQAQAEARARIRDDLLHVARGGASWRVSPAFAQEMEAMADVYRKQHRPVRRPAHRTDRWYAEWASRFDAARFEKAPIAYLAQRFGYSQPYVRQLRQECVKRDLLTANPGPGVYGGRMTDKAREILSGDDQAP